MTNIQLASEDWVNSGKTWENVVNTVKSIKYGRLYNWYAATDVRDIAPVGWHVPSQTEWQTLIDFVEVGSLGTAGDKLNNTGSNIYQFDLFSGGRMVVPSTHFSISINSQGFYQTSSNSFLIGDNTEVPIFRVNEGQPWAEVLNVSNNQGGSMQEGYSIRLIKDNSTNEGDIIIDGDTYHSVTIGTQVWLQQNLAVTHYQNGDPILSDFSGTVGAVCAYNNDESNVYDIVTVTDLTHIEPILSKMIYVNAVDFKSLVEYPDNATAISAGLTAGQLYTTTGSLKIVYSIAP